MTWPLPTDYFDAIQNPKSCFNDPELASASPELSKLGLPRVWSGNFASVFHLSTGTKDWAARCFLRDLPNRKERYKILSSYLSRLDIPWFADFIYLENAINIKGETFPILKMEWFKGKQIDEFIRMNLTNAAILTNLATQFLRMIEDLRINNIAHGDLQHGNILVVKGNLRLVDYDGMYVPGLKDLLPNEIGHVNYQHSSRTEDHYGQEIDNFSAWLIYISLHILASEPNLCRSLRALEGEYLVFKREDLEYPEGSDVFISLDNVSNPKIFSLIKYLENMAYFNYSEIPPLTKNNLNEIETIPLPPKVLPDWIEQRIPSGEEIDLESMPLEAKTVGSSWVLDHIEHPPRELFETNFNVERILSLTSGFLVFALLAMFILDIVAFSNMGIALLPGAPPIYFLSLGSFTFIGVLLQIIVLVITLRIRYQSLSVINKRRDLIITRNELEDKLDGVVEKIKSLEVEKQQLISEEQKEINGKKNEKENARISMGDQINRIENETRSELGRLKNQLNNIDHDEKKTMRDELSQLQDQSIRHYLAGASIRSAKIVGIGPVLTGRLNADGFQTAADISDIRIASSSWGRYTNDIAYLISAVGRSVKVEGIGPVKASAIKSWHKSVKEAAQRQMPLKLSPNRIQSILSQSQTNRQRLENQITVIKPRAETKKGEFRRKYSKIEKEIEKDIRGIRKKYQARKRVYIDEVNNFQKYLKKLRWQHATLDQKISSFRNITFVNYLFGIISSRLINQRKK